MANDKSIDSFVKNYSGFIREKEIEISKEMKQVSYKPNIRCKVVISKKTTSIGYVEKREIVNDKIIYREELVLTIGLEQIELMKNSRLDLSMEECINRAIMHEYMHIMLRDTDNVKKSNVYNFNEGVKKNNIPNSVYFVPRAGKDFDKKGYEKINHKVYNVAADFVINQILDITKPFMRPEDFNIPPDLNIYEYYTIIMQRKDRDKDLNKAVESAMDESVTIKIDISSSRDMKGNKMGNYKIPILSKKLAIKESKFLKDLAIEAINGEGRGFAMARKKAIDGFNDPFNKFAKELKDVCNFIRHENSNIKISTVSKEDSWFKYNKRNEGDLIFPGKKETTGNIDMKFKPKPVMFVDNSASMYEHMSDLYAFCYHLISLVSITIVFYDVRIIEVFDSINSIKMPLFDGGGTDFESVLEEYESKYNKVSNIYVLTDGIDYYPDRSNVWIIKDGKIKKKNNYGGFKNENY